MLPTTLCLGPGQAGEDYLIVDGALASEKRFVRALPRHPTAAQFNRQHRAEKVIQETTWVTTTHTPTFIVCMQNHANLCPLLEVFVYISSFVQFHNTKLCDTCDFDELN